MRSRRDPPTDIEDSSVGVALRSLRAAREDWRAARPEGRDVLSFPSRDAIEQVVEGLAGALYPRRIGNFLGPDEDEDDFVARLLVSTLRVLEHEISGELGYWEPEARGAAFDIDQPAQIVRLFADRLGDVRRLIDSDVEAAFTGDPAARSVDEILVCYPGAVASLHHRIAHELYGLGAPITARIISELANERTGIDIHPGATIGERFFIDHGTGVVIGETAIVGRNVRLYQHVTLGARTPAAGDDAPRQVYARHPLVEDDVVIYAGATILGRVTIGRGSVIGGNVWLLDDVPPRSLVLQPSASVVAQDGDGR